jgi:flagellar biosynthetic protein FlhB
LLSQIPFDEKVKKMMKQGVKEELKEAEGNPAAKSRIRKVWREVSRKRMIADVSEADVVLTDPTPPIMPLPCSTNWNQ